MQKMLQTDKEFFDKLRQIVPDKKTLAEQVSQLLKISLDGAYRKIRGEVALLYDHYVTLARHYGIDKHVTDSDKEMLFTRGSVQGAPDKLSDMFSGIMHDMRLLDNKSDYKYFLASDDMPFFWHFIHPILIKFKIHYWTNALNTDHHVAIEPFDELKYGGAFHEQIVKIRDYWLNIPSTEIVGPLPLNSIVNQIIYYRDAGLFARADIFEEIRKALLEVVDTMEKFCLHGSKFNPA
jgi:hypothetical protein